MFSCDWEGPALMCTDICHFCHAPNKMSDQVESWLDIFDYIIAFTCIAHLGDEKAPVKFRAQTKLALSIGVVPSNDFHYAVKLVRGLVLLALLLRQLPTVSGLQICRYCHKVLPHKRLRLALTLSLPSLEHTGRDLQLYLYRACASYDTIGSTARCRPGNFVQTAIEISGTLAGVGDS